MTIDAPTVPAPWWGPAPADTTTGRHWPHTVKRVGPDHRLSPAAYQAITRTEQQVPAAATDATGLLDLRLIDVRDVLTSTTADTAEIPAVDAIGAGQ